MLPGLEYTVSSSKTSWAQTSTWLQIATASGKPCAILKVKVTQETLTASGVLGIQIYRTANVITWTSPTTITASKLGPSSPTPGFVATAWGTSVTDGASPVVIEEDGWNQLGDGWQYIPVEKERLIVPASAYFCVKPLGTVTSGTWAVYVSLLEIG